jgi:hypothetical protein
MPASFCFEFFELAEQPHCRDQRRIASDLVHFITGWITQSEMIVEDHDVVTAYADGEIAGFRAIGFPKAGNRVKPLAAIDAGVAVHVFHRVGTF